MAQTLRLTLAQLLIPHSVAATMSQCSKALANFSRLLGLCRIQWSSFAKPHSEEYTPPHHLDGLQLLPVREFGNLSRFPFCAVVAP